ncbi:ATP-binding protein [Massilia varians]|jgi:hypothetical protein|uniref:ATP-binding protein n=1 Tax=Massilia consociata TaxID=760117 RepID=A0ABV6FEJ2_9BURK|nr:ATP-binding protein [Massilia sp. UMI-21]
MTVLQDSNGQGAPQTNSSVPEADSTTRPIDFEKHPVRLRTYSCSTLQAEELADRVAAWINQGVQQAVIFGPPGIGKTYAIRYVTEHLPAKFPDVRFLEVHAGAVSGAPGRERLFLEKHVMELIERAGQRSLVLWIDESQLLDPTTENTLRNLQDRLKNNGIRLLSVLVGHPRVRTLKQKRVAYASDFPTFVPSVPTEAFELHGMRSITEIEHCLKAFDNDCFPRDSGWSHTRFFLPQAYLNGFRLAAYAGDLWQEFVEADRTTGADTRTEVPMSYFAKTIEHALKEGAARDGENIIMDREFWKRAVHQSGWGERYELRHLVGESYALC